MKRKGAPDVWAFRWYEHKSGKRRYMKRIVGTVVELPQRRDAEKALLSFRYTINFQVAAPQKVCDLIAHYQQHELVPERKSFSSIATHLGMTRRYIEPKWGQYHLGDVRTMQVEEWLHTLPLAPASKTKIKSAFSVLYSHAIRYEWLTFNPISKVRTSSKPLREKDVLSPEEFRALLGELSVRDRAMVLLAGSTGLRRSEMIALTWADVNAITLEVTVLRSCVRNRFGPGKSTSSRRPVPLHLLVLEALLEWKRESLYRAESDFVFASLRLKGTKPMGPDNLLKRYIRPALQRAGIEGKTIGWHNFRHSLATNLRAMGVDVKVAQELLRHANVRTTLDIYTRAVSQQKREANAKVVEMMLPGASKMLQHLSAPSLEEVAL
ncbi:MAG: tyrosine-type recombinase/integrase [Terracidiphilus sp.]